MNAPWRPRPGELLASARTHRGLKRRDNEDTYLCLPERGRFVVIDGMGGANAGEVAAEHARAALESTEDLRRAILEANHRILSEAEADPEKQGMGCVLTAAQVRGERLVIAHVGDTRAYLARASGCRLLTRDHTAVAEEQDRRILSEAEARALPGQNRVTRDLGAYRWADASLVDVGDAPFEPGDLLLMCSDGLHDLVPSSELFEILADARERGESPERLSRRLQEMALERGGKDNVTVLVARREAIAAEAPAPGAARARILATLGVLALAALAAAAWFALSDPEDPPLRNRAALRPASGLTSASGLVAAGPAGLSGELRPQVLVPMGTLQADAGEHWTQVTQTAAPPTGPCVARGDCQMPEVTVRGMELRFPEGQAASWLIEVEPWAALELQQASIRAPELRLEIRLQGEGARVRIADSHLDVGALTVTGGEIELDGGQLRVGGAVEPQLEGVARADGPAAPAAPTDEQEG